MTLKALCYINQFYAGIGGEDMAHEGLHVFEGAKGPGIGMEGMWKGEMKIVRTLACGDNHFNVDEHYEALKPELKKLVEEVQPDVVIAGPAFNAGRYGVACAKFCDFVRSELGISAVCGMYPQNPAVQMFVLNNYITEATETATGMKTSLPTLAKFALKLAKREKIGPASLEGYIPTGHRYNEYDEKSGAERVVDILVKKLYNQPYRTEVPLRKEGKVPAAPALKDPSKAKFALITVGGLVPKGNPDRLRMFASVAYGTYPIDPDTFDCQHYESIHGGYDTTTVNKDPNRLIAYEEATSLQKEGVIGELAQYFLATCGIGTNVGMSMKLGHEMAVQLKKDGVQAVILTST